MINKLDEFDRLRLQLVLFMMFLVFIVTSILSYSIYLSYQNQRTSEITESQKSIYLDIIQKLDPDDTDLKKFSSYNLNLPENTIVCVYKNNLTRLCVGSENRQTLTIKNQLDTEERVIIYTNRYKDLEIYIATSKSSIERELKKLRMSIVISDILVLVLSGFLSYSVFGRLLSAVWLRINKLNQTLQIVSHDLRTPVAVIDANLYLIKSKRECSSPKLDSIEKNIRYIKNIIKNIDYLTEKLPNKIENVQINQLIKEILTKYSTYVEDKKIKIEIYEKDRFTIDGNYTDMEVLFTNLIDNAVKYNYPEGRVVIEIEPDRVYIKNTGPKIKDKVKIFEKYYREEASGTVHGMGLGLSIVRNLCKAYGLRVEVDHYNGMNVFVVSKR